MIKQQEEARLRQVNCRLIGESCTCDPDVLELPCFGCLKAYVESAQKPRMMAEHVKDFYDQREAQGIQQRKAIVARGQMREHRLRALWGLLARLGPWPQVKLNPSFPSIEQEPRK